MCGAGSSRWSRRVSRSGSKAIALASIALAAACGGTAKPTTTPAKSTDASSVAPYTFRVLVRANADSALKQVRFALGVTKGALQPPRVQGPAILLSARTSRERPNGGHREVSYLAAVSRAMTDSVTLVELSAWGIDVQPERTALMAPAGPPSARTLPTITTTSPTTMSAIQQQPFRVTTDDKPEWAILEEILAAMLDTGAEFAPPPRRPNEKN